MKHRSLLGRRIPLVLALSLATPVAPRAALGPGGGDAERIDLVVGGWMERPGAVGLSVAAGRGAELVFSKAFGSADLEFDVPADEETMFRIGSVTKQFTAAAVVRLAEREKLVIDELLTKYLPDYPAQGREVTLRHLLTHTSGIPSYTNLGPAWLQLVSRELTHEEMLDLFQDQPFEFEPGTRWSYNNSGYYLLGMVIERASDLSYADYLGQEFFEPLGLTRTRYDSNGEVIKNRAQGYGFEDGRTWNDRLIGMSQPGAAGGLISTARDLVRWQIALVSGQVVSPAGYEEMTLPYLLADGHETTYGFGLGLPDVAGQRCISHGGGIFGFNSWLGYFPDQQLSVAVISNSEAISSEAIAQEIARAMLTED